jgi:hypothetical protein
MSRDHRLDGINRWVVLGLRRTQPDEHGDVLGREDSGRSHLLTGSS